MDLFKKVKVVRLLTNDGKYLTACQDKKTVSLQTITTPESVNANWSVEYITSTTDPSEDKFQLWSCYRKTLQITSILTGTVRQMNNGKQSWFPGWEARVNPSSTSSTVRVDAIWLGTCKCFLEARDPLKLIRENSVADRGKVYKLDWFVEVVESRVLDEPMQGSRIPNTIKESVLDEPMKVSQIPYPIKECPPCNSNFVMINYSVESGQLGFGGFSQFNSGQNINGSGIQKNEDVNVKYEIATGQDININFK